MMCGVGRASVMVVLSKRWVMLICWVCYLDNLTLINGSRDV